MKITSKKGFTLIELLAVIVILAIIALIAVPVVMNIITKSQKSAFKDSAYGIIKAGELYYADRLLEPEGMTEDKMFTFPNDTTGLDLKGSKPSNGSIIITKEGKVAIGITDGKYCITKGFEDSDVTVTDKADECYNPEVPKTLSQLATTGTFTKVDGSDETKISEIHECAKDKTEGACAPGTEFAIKVNGKDIYRFFVLSDSGEKVTLIMDRNLGGIVAWTSKANYIEAGGTEAEYDSYGNNNKGPLTALTALQLQTNTWTDLPKMTISTFDYDDEREDVTLGNNKTYTMYARLPKYSELNDIVSNNGGTMPTWLYINLMHTGDNTEPSKYSYWTSTASSSYSSDARHVSAAYYLSTTYVLTANSVGVRPVIELSK